MKHYRNKKEGDGCDGGANGGWYITTKYEIIFTEVIKHLSIMTKETDGRTINTKYPERN